MAEITHLGPTPLFVEEQKLPIVPKDNIVVHDGIKFEKYIITKQDDLKGRDLAGCFTITKDENHVGFLHVLIFIGQIVSRILSAHCKSWSQMKDEANFCHAEMILKINTSKDKEGHRILAHGLFRGISTSCEDHKKDRIITQLVVFRPVDEKLRKLFAKNAEQTAANYRMEFNKKLNNEIISDKISKKQKLTLAERKIVKAVEADLTKEISPFSIKKMLGSAFVKQKINESLEVQTRIAYAAADILLGHKLHNEKGKIASYFCSAYLMTLTLGSALIYGLTDGEVEAYKTMDREELKAILLERIQSKMGTDPLNQIYTKNDFMRTDAYHTLSYYAAKLLSKNSEEKAFSDLPMIAPAA